ncbi:pilus assembly protein PilY [Pseudomonas sp. PDM18]|uniref:pilus assembly protein n=1 Tax=Pseudomonas sp. PDM18 TaxID=2769253 RepID=UPI001782825A|nr:PilC/PilY family type IV pilus protein [Pseudomonas sp. PDM18]MBD9679730.1 pilus assembly protein PilY [Pseudomonas sp. PDM18]
MKTQGSLPILQRVLVCCVVCLASIAAQAEDIDLFVGTPPNAADAPNVLIIMDNTANWNKQFPSEQAALYSLIGALPENKFRVGLMMFSETGSPNSNVGGGYVRAAIRLMDASSKTKYQALVNSISTSGSTKDAGNAGNASLVMAEAWAYYSGGTPYSGNNKEKADYTGNVAGTAASKAIYALPNNALSAFNGSRYTSPVVAGCAKNFIIYISNGAPQDPQSVITLSEGLLNTAGGDKSQIPVSPAAAQDNVADEWSRFMKKSALNVTTYTVDVDKVTNNPQGIGWTALLKSMANVSSGKYFDVSSNGSGVADALNAIFSEIQATNSVFASVTLPVSVNTQSTYLNQVFVGMFRPDMDSFPRWPGNLKQYKLGMVSGALKTVDADGQSAINTSTGFVTECARSFWTPSTADSYWAFRPQGGCLTVTGADASNYPDGNIVEKGAQAYRLRQGGTRTVKTCSASSCTALTNFDTSNGAAIGLLGTANTTERDALINWARGDDTQDENTNANLTEVRPSVHGDVVHSRPAAVNYGTASSPQVVVYYGGNDGLLRAVNGNRTTAIGSVPAGSEIWSFMPPEFYPNIKRLRDNSVTIAFPGHTTGTPTPQPKAYGMDGSVTTVRQGSSTWIYAAMRRGGRALYSFDVSTLGSPSLKWKIGCPNVTNDTGCSTGYSNIGQTWATPVAFKAAGYGSGASTILAMGGGYDACEDGDPNTCTSSSKGNRIYMIDADTGTALKTFTTDRGVVGDITMVANSNGQAVYGYAADLGGNVYRISGADAVSPIGTTLPANWTITKIASLGCNSTSSCTANRKFLYGPEVAVSNGQYIILLGSGDREKPLLSYTSAASVANRFYALRDSPSDSTWLTGENTTCSANVICNASLLAITSTANPSDADLAAHPKGWYLGLASSEQVVTSALLLFDTIIFSTHAPQVATSTSCVGLGTARNYNINYRNASAPSDRFQVIAGGGLPPSPVAGVVQLDDGTQKPFIIGGGTCATDSSLQGCEAVPPASGTRPKSWVFWDIER